MQSLRSLHLQMTESWDFDAPLGLLPTLRDFASLTKVDVDLAVWSDILSAPSEEDADVPHNATVQFLYELDEQDPLYDRTERLRDRLPSSLTRLILRECVYAWEDVNWDYRQVEDLILNRGSHLSNLKLVEVVEVSKERPTYPRLVELARTTMNGANGLCWLVNSTVDDYLSHSHTVFLDEDDHIRPSMALVQWKEDKYISLDGKM